MDKENYIYMCVKEERRSQLGEKFRWRMDGTCKNDGNNNVFDGGTLFVTGTIFCCRRSREEKRTARMRLYDVERNVSLGGYQQSAINPCLLCSTN